MCGIKIRVQGFEGARGEENRVKGHGVENVTSYKLQRQET
jgi:hypothetical protein